ncbi:hypothetical protein DRN73_04475 [Candidatus Pacearchaeota archaeon]|nr:MAG: hypothetical protein DRN73_04475 [Candidatus Pacearchaeota archaeon]
MLDFIKNLAEFLSNASPFVIFLYVSVSFVTYMPVGPDVFLISKCCVNHSFPIWSFLATILGYSIGISISYFLGLKGRVIIKKRFKKIEKWFNKYGTVSSFIVALTPLPLREFCLIAGFLKIPFLSFLFFSILGLSLKYTVEILIALGILGIKLL